jgi:D-glycero-D-manno-heptose 1,7-bisphosphate phosphatase
MMSLYIFDKDGTLLQHVRSSVGVKRTPLRPQEQLLRVGVFERLAALRAEGHALALASNQSIVARGLVSLEEAQKLMENCAAKVGGVSAFRFSPYSPHAKKVLDGKPNPYARDDPTRKPRPGMILELMKELGYKPADTWMIGDSKLDREAARAAGTRFMKASRFFLGYR